MLSLFLSVSCLTVRRAQILNYMVHKNVPAVIPLNQLDSETPQVRLERALEEAYSKLGVPLLMEAKVKVMFVLVCLLLVY